ncbi:LytS family sensor histidine kinase [Parapedobacter koreensis]|uniref:Sensor histidine kinase YesM n=1 Tax=Parapedobacter koreensis TaxID=332977 RepID=A0A1H7U8Y3_9SPHI|nr:hypothetical protein [Parapedobacter koreensis]SEL93463.1 Sensor histidine kinase YesM [Parapedobacter koreensis]
METTFSNVSFHFRYHLYVLVGYSLVVFGMNLLGNKDVYLAGLTLMIGINIVVFYSLNGICNRFFTYSRVRLLAVQLFGLIIAWYVVVYLLIYVWFPGVGIALFHTGREFHIGKYVRNLTSYLEKSLMAVLIYQFAKLNKARQLVLLAEKEKIIEKERQLKEVAERALAAEKEHRGIAQENQRLRFAASSGQLKSHWLHSVTASLREKIGRGLDVTELFDAYLEVLNYYYQHGGPDANLVTLQAELHLVRLMQLLNGAINNNQPALVILPSHPLIARQIPPFLMSTLLENAFKFADQSGVDEPITLAFSSTAKMLAITCRNGVDPAKVLAAPKSGVGLRSIRQQLDYLAPSRHEITIVNEGRMYEIAIVIHY